MEKKAGNMKNFSGLMCSFEVRIVPHHACSDGNRGLRREIRHPRSMQVGPGDRKDMNYPKGVCPIVVWDENNHIFTWETMLDRLLPPLLGEIHMSVRVSPVTEFPELARLVYRYKLLVWIPSSHGQGRGVKMLCPTLKTCLIAAIEKSDIGHITNTDIPLGKWSRMRREGPPSLMFNW